MREGGKARLLRFYAALHPRTNLRSLLNILRWGWVIPVVAGIDIAVRRGQAALWVPVEWVAYAVSVAYALMSMRVAHWLFATIRRRANWAAWGAVFVLQGVLTFVLVTHFTHYAYFGVPPELQTITIAYDAPGEALRAVVSQLTPLNIALLVGLTAGLGLTWRRGIAHPPNSKSAAIAAGIALLLTPGIYHNVYEGRGSFLPGVNFSFHAARATQAYLTGERFRRLPMANWNGLPRVAKRQPYNVLFILGETLRSKSVSYEGYTRDTTPLQRQFLERFRDQSFIFRYCYSNSIRTNPSVPSVLSGVHPMEFPDKLIRSPLLYKYGKFFSDTRTFLISSQSYGDYDYINFFRSPLLDYMIYQENSGKKDFNWAGMDDANVVPFLKKELDAVTGLAEHTASKELKPKGSEGRFFGIIHLNGTHFPYHAPPEFRRWKTGTELDSYENAILYQDSTVRAVLDELEKRGLLENTIVVFTADHGEAMGEHGRSGHSHGYPYQEITQVAAWMYLPKPLAKLHGAVLRLNTERNVSNLDWVPTLTELLGMNQDSQIRSITKDLLGKNLLEPVDPDRVIVVQNDVEYALSLEGFAVIHRSEQFLYHPSGGIRIFDTAHDPGSVDNLWPSMGTAARQRWLTLASAYPGILPEIEGAMELQSRRDISAQAHTTTLLSH